MPKKVTTDLESDLKEDLLSCDLGQINAIPNQYGRLLNLFVFIPLQTLGCGLASRLFFNLIVTTGLTNCRWVCGFVNLRRLKWVGNGLGPVLLIARQ
jgi:hypothetical protein